MNFDEQKIKTQIHQLPNETGLSINIENRILSKIKDLPPDSSSFQIKKRRIIMPKLATVAFLAILCPLLLNMIVVQFEGAPSHLTSGSNPTHNVLSSNQIPVFPWIERLLAYFQNFMDYFGNDSGFLGSLIIYFPFSVILFSITVNLFTQKIFIAPIVVFIIFGTFFAYAYSQFNAVVGNFAIPLIMYIIFSFFFGWGTNKIKRKFLK